LKVSLLVLVTLVEIPDDLVISVFTRRYWDSHSLTHFSISPLILMLATVGTAYYVLRGKGQPKSNSHSHPLAHSHTHRLPLAHIITHFAIRPEIHSCNHPLTLSLNYSSFHSVTHPPNKWLVHSSVHSYTPPIRQKHSAAQWRSQASWQPVPRITMAAPNRKFWI
jgi:hypothetical protein